MLDAETTIDSAIAALKAGLPARCAALDAERGDFTLKVPDDDAYSLGSSEVIRYPWIEVAVIGTDVLSFDIGQGAGDQISQIIVACRYQSAIGEQLDRALRRYSRAICEVLTQPNAFGDHDVVSEIRIAYGTNPELDIRQMFTGVVAVGFALEGVASFT